MNLSSSSDELCSCQCITTLYGEKKETEKLVLRILLLLQTMLENSRKGHQSFLGPGSEVVRKLTCTNQMENGDDVADIMMTNFCESGHLVFRGSSAFERRDLKCKGATNPSK